MEKHFFMLLVVLVSISTSQNWANAMSGEGCSFFDGLRGYTTKRGTAVEKGVSINCKLQNSLKTPMNGRHLFKLPFDISWLLDAAGADNILCFVFLQIWCLTLMELDFRNQQNLVNKNVILHLSITGECRLFTKNLVTWTRATDLRKLSLIGKKYRFTNISQGNEYLARNFEQIVSLENFHGSLKNTPNMFTNTENVWPNMAEISFVNMSIKKLPGHWKHTMPLLQSLNLALNNLREPPEFPWNNSTLEIFRGMRRTDAMQRYNFDGVHVESNLYIRSLYLSSNNIEDLSSYEFRGFLHVLRLDRNGLKKVGPSCFHRLEGIQTIHLTGNKLVSLPENLFQGLTSLQNIFLGKNKLSIIEPKLFEGLKNIKKLYLDHNNLRFIPPGLFNSLNTLEVLHLDANKITNIEETPFPKHSSLRQLYLQENNLSTIPPWIFSLSKIEVIDLSSNGLTFEDLHKAIESYESYHVSVARAPIDLKLANNKITTLVDSTAIYETIRADRHIFTVQQDKYFYFWKAFSITLNGNPLICDCIMSAVAKLLGRNPYERYRFKTWQCDWPHELKNQSILEIEENLWMQRKEPDNCPAECVCRKRCSDGIVVVDCEKKSLIEVPSSMPQGLIELNLRNNEIKDIPAYPYLLNVTVLKLSNNKVDHLQTSVVQKLKHVKIFLIDSNKLTSLPRETETLNFTTLAVSQNPFKCDCTTKWMKYWLRKNKHRIKNVQNVLCSSHQAVGQAMYNLSDDEFVCSTANKKLSPYTVEENVTTGTIAAFILGGLLLFIAIVVVLLYKYHGELKVFMFTHLNWHPFDRIDDSDPNKIYDAFISYSGDDHQWVVNTLQERLEKHNPPYKLCIHHRDFRIGAPIQENILASVDQSKRMLMVLSPSFAKSGWCLLEFRAAHRKVLEDRINYLIIIVFDDIDMAELDEEIKLYMRTNTYVSVSDKWFWQKLFYAMPQRSEKESVQERSVELIEPVTANHDNYVERMQETESRAAALSDSDTKLLV